MKMANGEVAEFEGFYGPYQVPERLLQKIWAKGLFHREEARDRQGRKVEVLSAGEWNRCGGPDFRRATILLDGERRDGDVEIHFRSRQWREHRHDQDTEYGRVVLHVLLFPPQEGEFAPRDAEGKEIPVLVLLPLLLHDLEEYVYDDVLEAASGQIDDALYESLRALGLEERWQLLTARAHRRWEQKWSFTGRRVARLGWEEACHSLALEILGYQANRTPMMMLAERFPLDQWRKNPPEVEELLTSVESRWSRQGLRPANQPRVRLKAYLQWVATNPDWPKKLEAMAARLGEIPPLPERSFSVAKLRREKEFSLWREEFRGIMGEVLSGPRAETVVCDGFLPLLSAKSGKDYFGWWFCWYPGDFPEALQRILREAEVVGKGRQPKAHGWGQGILGLLQERGEVG